MARLLQTDPDLGVRPPDAETGRQLGQSLLGQVDRVISLLRSGPQNSPSAHHLRGAESPGLHS